MEIKTKFSIGDFVYVIKKFGENKYMGCKACNGKGGIYNEGNYFKCNTCYGSGGKYVWVAESWKVAYKKTKVGKICVEIYNKKYYKDNPERKDREICYMVEATGVGSGTIWPENQIFKTLQEAEKECEIRNS